MPLYSLHKTIYIIPSTNKITQIRSPWTVTLFPLFEMSGDMVEEVLNVGENAVPVPSCDTLEAS
jgi:hypothetical protein